jgi:hypothetical protein
VPVEEPSTASIAVVGSVSVRNLGGLFVRPAFAYRVPKNPRKRIDRIGLLDQLETVVPLFGKGAAI